MAHEKFDMRKLEKLNDPGRFETLRPLVMWEALGRPEPHVIVEIGAGTGLFAATFAGLAEGSVVYAADTEQTMIDWMRAHRPEVAAGRVLPVHSRETHVPLDDGVADLVVMINLHHELVDPAAVYVEASRLLAEGGQILVVDWAPIETPRGPSLSVRIGPADAEAFLEAAGFSDVTAHDTLPWHWLVTGSKPA